MTRARIALVAAVAAAALAGGAALFVHSGGAERIARAAKEWRLRHGSREARLEAVRRLVEDPDDDMRPALEACLEDPDRDLRCCALWALGVLGDPAAAPAVRRRLESESADESELRYAAFAAG